MRIDLSMVGAVCAILYAFALVAALALLASTDLLDADDAAEILPILDEDKTIVAIAGWLFVVAPILLAIAGLAFAETLSKTSSMMRVALLAFLGGSLLALIRNIIWLALIYELAPAYVDASDDARSTLAANGDVWITFGYIAGDLIGGVLVGGVGVALFSAALLRADIVPTWIAWLGFAAALLAGWVTPLAPAAEVFEAINFIGLVIFLAWMVAMGLVLWRRSLTVDEGSQFSRTLPQA